MAKKKVLAYEDLKKLKETFKKMDNDKSKLALSLLDEAYFCGDTLKKLKEKVEKDGVVTKMCQGNYNIDREMLDNIEVGIKEIMEVIQMHNSEEAYEKIEVKLK